MKICLSIEEGIMGICGHIGVGHTHSHSGFVQDDAAGLSVAASILKQALPIDTTIISAKADINKSLIIVKTKDNGVGQVWVRREITPWESDLITNIVGMDAIYAQEIALRAFGSIYGQGTMEVAASLQAAIALSLIDTFKVNYSNDLFIVDEDIPLNIGKILGTVIDIDGIPISIMLTVNASLGGIGPIEDLEGNIMLGKKGELIKRLRLDKIPTIIIESKNYMPKNCDSLEENTFLVRCNLDFDNLVVADCLIESASQLGINYNYDFDTLIRGIDGFKNSSFSLGQRIVDYGELFKKAESSQEKVKIISELAILVREDAGGVTFMSNNLQKNVASAGMMKGTSAVLSLQVTKEYIQRYKVPFVTESDISDYQRIIYNAIPKLYKKIDLASIELKNKFNFNEQKYIYITK